MPCGRWLLLVALILTFATHVQAQVNIAPGQSIQAVIDSTNMAGTTYILQAGTHRMQAFTPLAGDTFRGELSGSTKLTIVDGRRVLTDWVQDGSVWYVTGQTQGGDETGDPLDCLPARPTCQYPEDLFVNDFIILGRSATLMAMGPFEWFFDYANDRIYIGFDPTGATITTSVTRKLVVDSSANNVTIEDLIIQGYASPNQDAAFAIGTGWVVDNIECRWSHYACLWSGSNSTVRNSYFHHNGNSALLGAGANILVEDNELAYNGIAAGFNDLANPAGFDPYWGAGGTKWVYATGLIVRRNYSHHNYGAGFWTDINNGGPGAAACLYEDNIASDNHRAGIFHEISYECLITGNTVERNGLTAGPADFPNILTNCGIDILSSYGVEVTANIVRDNWGGICIWDDTRNTSGTPDFFSLNVVNVNVHHNTIRQAATTGAGGIAGGFQDAEADGFDGAGNVFANNTYCLTGADYPAAVFEWDGSVISVSAWQETGNDQTSSFTACAKPVRMRFKR